MPATIETTVYRVVQEALNNVTRHAHAATARIRLRRFGNLLHCTVQDDGVGFDVEQVIGKGSGAGLGLVGMRERLAALGGRVGVRSSPGCGTGIVIIVPLEE